MDPHPLCERITLRCACSRLALATLFSAAAVAQGWSQIPVTGPQPRQLPRMACDIGRNQIVLFGGYSRTGASANAETWLFDGATWTQAAPVTVPTRRDTHCMSYDLARGVVVMFGGVDTGNFPASITNETWEWNGTDWTLRTPALAPAPRFGMGMAFDSSRNVHVMFGGSTSTGITNQTWEWDGVNWTQMFPATVPPVRANQGMAFDSGRGRVVMFGGRGSASLGDTWEYDGLDWRQVATPFAPAARTGLALAYDMVRGVSVLHGGLVGTGSLNNETWEYDGRDWYRYQQIVPPLGTGRTNAAVAYMPGITRTVLFGGAGSTDLADTWTFGGAVASAAVYGTGCAGTAGTPSLAAASLPALGGSLNLQLSAVPNNGFTFLVAALGGAGNLPLPGTACNQRVLPPLVIQGALASGTAASYVVTVPGNAALAGLVVHFQGAALDTVNPLGVIVSNALRAIVN